MGMFNPYTMRKWAALILPGLLCTVGFYVMTVFYGLLYGIAAFLVFLILGAVLGLLFLKNPFGDMLEGKGILAVNLDSTGIMQFFIVKVQSPFIRGKVFGRDVKDVFDREAVSQMATPVNNMTPANMTYEDDGAKLKITLDKDLYNKSRFAFQTYPVLIWNDQVKSFLTKDFLASQEKMIFAEHGVLYLNRLMEELTSVVRDFGRYVVELTKPASSILGNKWFWIIIVGAVILMGVLFAPAIIDAVKGTGAAQAAGSVISGQPVVTPAG